MRTVYNTGKVKIGLTYIPPARKLSAEERQLQRALLGDRRSLAEAFINALLRRLRK